MLFPISQQVDVSRAVAVDYDDRDLRTDVAARRRLPPHRRAAGHEDVLDRASSATSSTTSCARAPWSCRSTRSSSCTAVPASRRPSSPSGATPPPTPSADAETAKLRDKYEAKHHQAADRPAGGRRQGRAVADATTWATERGGAVDRRLGPRRPVRRAQVAQERLGSVFGSAGTAAGRRSRTVGCRRSPRCGGEQDPAAARPDRRPRAADGRRRPGDRPASGTPSAAEITTLAVPLERSDVNVTQLALVWLPVS